VNDYWFREWKGAKLTYRLRTRDGKVVKDLTRTFDLPADSTVPVIAREDTGDVWHVPGGFFADLEIYEADGKLVSENHYDFTEEEVQAFLTSVYPLAPVEPANSVVLTTDKATSVEDMQRQPSEGGTYSREVLKTVPGGKPHFEFLATVEEASNYYIRISVNSGKVAHQLDLTIDGKKAPLEQYATLDANEHLTRDVYATPEISWYPGWTVRLEKGPHRLVFSVPPDGAIPELEFDAVLLQSYKDLSDPFFVPSIRDMRAESEVGPIN